MMNTVQEAADAVGIGDMSFVFSKYKKKLEILISIILSFDFVFSRIQNPAMDLWKKKEFILRVLLIHF